MSGLMSAHRSRVQGQDYHYYAGSIGTQAPYCQPVSPGRQPLPAYRGAAPAMRAVCAQLDCRVGSVELAYVSRFLSRIRVAEHFVQKVLRAQCDARCALASPALDEY